MINLKALSLEYKEFLKNHRNVGCPILATALTNIIGGKVIVGEFCSDPHAWVELSETRYDLNNLVEGEGIFLIMSSTIEGGYLSKHNNALKFALELGISKEDFAKWTKRFTDSMLKKKEVAGCNADSDNGIHPNPEGIGYPA